MHSSATLLLFACALLPACSSSSNTSLSADGGTSSDASTSTGSTSDSGTNPAVATDSTICAGIPLADVQAVVTNLVSDPATVIHDDCSFYDPHGYYLPVSFDLSDADKSIYNQASEGTATAHAISGIGDSAYWLEVDQGASVPQLSAHKGNVSCIIQPRPDLAQDVKLTTTPDASAKNGFTVADNDAIAFVQLMGKICNDVFAAAGQ